jgi:hypothetical protein
MFPRTFDLFQRPSARLRQAEEKDNRDVVVRDSATKN